MLVALDPVPYLEWHPPPSNFSRVVLMLLIPFLKIATSALVPYASAPECTCPHGASIRIVICVLSSLHSTSGLPKALGRATDNSNLDNLHFSICYSFRRNCHPSERDRSCQGNPSEIFLCLENTLGKCSYFIDSDWPLKNLAIQFIKGSSRAITIVTSLYFTAVPYQCTVTQWQLQHGTIVLLWADT